MVSIHEIIRNNLDLQQYAENISLSDNGVWFARDHRDQKFMENDETDWPLVERSSFWYAHRTLCFQKIINLYPPKGNLFEIGAGSGSVSLALQEAGYSLVAVEPTVKWARLAKERGVNHVICANVETAKFKKGSLDNVGMFDVLEHIQDDEKFLEALHHLITPGGRFYCAVPAMPILWSEEDRAAEHLRRYTQKSLGKLLDRAGFKPEYGTYYFTMLFMPVLWFRTIPSLLGLRRARTHDLSYREHHIKSKFVEHLMNYLLRREVAIIGKGGKRILGTSCMIVASAR